MSTVEIKGDQELVVKIMNCITSPTSTSIAAKRYKYIII